MANKSLSSGNQVKLQEMVVKSVDEDVVILEEEDEQYNTHDTPKMASNREPDGELEQDSADIQSTDQKLDEDAAVSKKSDHSRDDPQRLPEKSHQKLDVLINVAWALAMIACIIVISLKYTKLFPLKENCVEATLDKNLGLFYKCIKCK